MATSDVPIPARCAWRFTVSNNQVSVEFAGRSMTRAPVKCFAVHFEIAREVSDPLNPIMATKINSAL